MAPGRRTEHAVPAAVTRHRRIAPSRSDARSPRAGVEHLIPGASADGVVTEPGPAGIGEPGRQPAACLRCSATVPAAQQPPRPRVTARCRLRGAGQAPDVFGVERALRLAPRPGPDGLRLDADPRSPADLLVAQAAARDAPHAFAASSGPGHLESPVGTFLQRVDHVPEQVLACLPVDEGNEVPWPQRAGGDRLDLQAVAARQRLARRLQQDELVAAVERAKRQGDDGNRCPGTSSPVRRLPSPRPPSASLSRIWSAAPAGDRRTAPGPPARRPGTGSTASHPRPRPRAGRPDPPGRATGLEAAPVPARPTGRSRPRTACRRASRGNDSQGPLGAAFLLAPSGGVTPHRAPGRWPQCRCAPAASALRASMACRAARSVWSGPAVSTSRPRDGGTASQPA